MRAVARLLAVVILAAAGSAVAQEKHLIDPTPPGSLNPGWWIAASGIACVDDDARARTTATLIILII